MRAPGRLFAWLVGWVWWTVLPVRKALAVENYTRAFPGRDPGELRRTVGELVLGYWELLRGVPAEVVLPWDHDGGEARPGIILCGHGGAWELALLSGAQRIPLTVFVRTPSNPLAAWLIARLRRRGDLELLPPSGSMARAYEALEEGRFVVFVQDQRHNRGIPVPFLGRPAWTSPALAAMAWRTRAPLYFAWPERTPAGHRVELRRTSPELPEEREAAIRVLTSWSQECIEAALRSRPHSWLWLHDRWRSPGGRKGPVKAP